MPSVTMSTATIAIDLGAANCRVAVERRGGRVETIANGYGNRDTPSCVAWAVDGEVLVGEAARDQAADNPERTVFDVKRLLGRRYDDDEIRAGVSSKEWPFKVVEEEGEVMVSLPAAGGGREVVTLSPEEITAKLLAKMRRIAEAHLDAEVKDVVLTVPGLFDERQRQALKRAAALAGLRVVKMVTETKAAATTCVRRLKAAGEPWDDVLIVDLGRTSLGLAVFSPSTGKWRRRSYAIDPTESRLFGLLYAQLDKQCARHGVDLAAEARLQQQLRDETERAKLRLSGNTWTDIQLLLPTGDDFFAKVKRSDLEGEGQTSKLCKVIKAGVLEVLGEADRLRSDIRRVLLLGGSTHLSIVRSALRTLFKRKAAPVKLEDWTQRGGVVVEKKGKVMVSLLAAGGGREEVTLSDDVLIVDLGRTSLGLAVFSPSTGKWRRRSYAVELCNVIKAGVLEVLGEADRLRSDIRRVLLLGGSTHLSIVRSALRTLFEHKRSKNATEPKAAPVKLEDWTRRGGVVQGAAHLVAERSGREAVSPAAPGPKAHGPKSPGPKSPGTKSPGPKSPGTKSPGPKSPGTKSPGPKSPGPEAPGSPSPGLGSEGGAARASLVPPDVKFVFIDTGPSEPGRDRKQIVQLAAKCESNTFSVYTNPVKDDGAFYYEDQDGTFTYKKKVVPHTPRREMLDQFCEFLEGLNSKIILVAHHAAVDAYPLIKHFTECDMLPRFEGLVEGVTDTLPIISNIITLTRRKAKLVNLKEEYVPEFTPSTGAHNALCDSEVLEQLCLSCSELNIGRDTLYGERKPVLFYILKKEMNDVSNETLKQLAENKCTMKTLAQQYCAGGRDGLFKFLNENITRRKSDINKIINKVKKYCQQNDYAPIKDK